MVANEDGDFVMQDPLDHGNTLISNESDDDEEHLDEEEVGDLKLENIASIVKQDSSDMQKNVKNYFGFIEVSEC